MKKETEEMLELLHKHHEEEQTKERIENQLKAYSKKEQEKKEKKAEKRKKIIITIALTLALIPVITILNNWYDSDMETCQKNGLSENVCYKEIHG